MGIAQPRESSASGQGDPPKVDAHGDIANIDGALSFLTSLPAPADESEADREVKKRPGDADTR